MEVSLEARDQEKNLYKSGFKILSIDPGSRVAGFACLQTTQSPPLIPKNFKIIGAGAIKSNLSLSHNERIGKIHQVIKNLINEFNPNICVIEKAFVGINLNSALKLGETRGAIISAIKALNVEIEELTPAFVKKSITGNGRASKEEVEIAIKNLLNFDLGSAPFDVSDAIAIGLCYGLKVLL